MIVATSRYRRTRRLAWDALSLILAAAWLLPLATMALTAIKPDSEINTPQFSWVPHAPTLAHFGRAWHLAPFGRFYANSIMVAAATTLIVLVIGSMAAFALCRLQFRGQRLLLGAIMSTTMVPFQVLLIPFFILLTTLGLVNSLLGLVMAYVAILLPFAIFMLVGFMRHLPREVEESARVDGCSWLGVWWRIGLPMSRPALAAVGVYTFVECWKEFFIALVMTNSQSIRTIPIGLALFRTDQPGIGWGEIMAGALTAGLPAVLVFVAMQRWFIAGLTDGAVKG